ncbi:MAG: hypothetical protein RL033_4770 [Pseudomonadota bacterium]
MQSKLPSGLSGIRVASANETLTDANAASMYGPEAAAK